MRIADAVAWFRTHLTNLGLRLDSEDVRTVFAAMADWYEQERAEDATSIEEDGDMPSSSMRIGRCAVQERFQCSPETASRSPSARSSRHPAPIRCSK
jgi:hypothetical protein